MNSSMGAETTSRDFNTMAMVREPGPKFAEHAIDTDGRFVPFNYEALKAVGLAKAGVSAATGGGSAKPIAGSSEVDKAGEGYEPDGRRVPGSSAVRGAMPVTGAATHAESGSDSANRFDVPMMSPAETLASLAADAWGPIMALSRMIGWCARRVEHAVRERRDRTRLHAMPDHLLKDLGLARCEIPSLTAFRETDITRRSRSVGN